MQCDHCGSHFEFERKHGGNNRTFCFRCVPEGLTKSERAKVHQLLRKEKSQAMKLNIGCSLCGYSRCATALEWHHQDDDKLHDPSNAIKRSWKAYMEEISQCVLLCANCHREVHEGVVNV